MTTRVRRLVPVLCLVVGFGAAQHARAQADPQNFLFSSGQTIQPFFEGWAHNPDGSFEMHFGYLNRNYVEELHVPIGADNRIEPASRAISIRGSTTACSASPCRPTGVTGGWYGS